eukprot:10373309-Heterocapsa_arctica.AAC.2
MSGTRCQSSGACRSRWGQGPTRPKRLSRACRGVMVSRWARSACQVRPLEGVAPRVGTGAASVPVAS